MGIQIHRLSRYLWHEHIFSYVITEMSHESIKVVIEQRVTAVKLLNNMIGAFLTSCDIYVGGNIDEIQTMVLDIICAPLQHAYIRVLVYGASCVRMHC